MDRTKIKTILLSRVDNLGDAILLLPAAGILKNTILLADCCFWG